MYYTEEEARELDDRCLGLVGDGHLLRDQFAVREYRNDRSYEFVRYGFCRRLKVLIQCLENVFDILPPNRADLPAAEELSEAEINIQAFVINVFGSIDNLAWIYVCESDLTQRNGRALPPEYVGLRPKNRLVRDALSAGFREYLEGLDDWFQNLESFRHALAHRIPLYIPPCVVPGDRMPEYRNLEERMNDARRRGDWDECRRLSVEQDRLGEFRPLMTHSFDENAPQVDFHPQMLNDLDTVEAIAQRMLQELER